MSRSLTTTWDDPRAAATAVGRMNGFEFMQSIMRGGVPVPPFGRLLGFEIDSVKDGEVTFSLEPEEQHCNPFGVLHGGVAASLFDSALGCAVHTQLAEGRIAPTMQLSINYIRPITVSTGKVRCTGQVVHLGKRSATAQGSLVDRDGKLYAHATGTFVISEVNGVEGR